MRFTARHPFRKPERIVAIDRGHYTARGLQYCWLLQEGAGTTITDLCSGIRGTITDTSNVKWTFVSGGAIGISDIDSASTTTGITLQNTPALIYGNDSFSVEALIYPNSLGGSDTYGTIFASRNAGAVGLYVRDDVSRIEWFDGTNFATPTGSLAAGRIQHIVAAFTKVGSGATAFRGTIYLNGCPRVTSNAGSRLPARFDSIFNDGGSQDFNGSILLIRTYTIALTEGQVFGLATAPYAMFAQPIRMSFHTAASAVTGMPIHLLFSGKYL